MYYFEIVENRNHRGKPDIRNMAFLKRHDMSGFLDNSFLVSDGMSDFGDIVFQNWRGQSEKSKLSLLFFRSLLQI